MYITHAKKDPIHTLKIVESMSEFDGNTKITQHALTVLESFMILKLDTTQSFMILKLDTTQSLS